MTAPVGVVAIPGGTYSQVIVGRVSDPSHEPIEDEWVKFVHVNGGVYYWNRDKHIITENNMEDAQWRKIILAIYGNYIETCEELGVFRDGYAKANSDVIIRYCDDELPELDAEDSDSIFEELPVELLLVSHETCCEVSLPSDGPDIVVEVNTYRYWVHVEEYPLHLQMHPQVGCILDRAKETFLCAMAYHSNDRLFERKDTFTNLRSDQIERLFEIHRDLLDAVSTNPSATTILLWYQARVIQTVKNFQESLNHQYCLTRDARLGYGVPRPPELSASNPPLWKAWSGSTLYYVLTCVFFASNENYRTRLQKTRFASSVYLEDFRHMIGEFLSEWSDSNLLATVFVNANVAFLSIGSITTLQRTACLLSTIFSIVSIGTGLYHVWHHRVKAKADIVDAVKYVYLVQGPRGNGAADISDTFLMSFFLAVPIASLLWAVVCFSFAMAASCVQNTSRGGSIVLLITLGIAAFVGGFTLVSLKNLWRPGRVEKPKMALAR